MSLQESDSRSHRSEQRSCSISAVWKALMGWECRTVPLNLAAFDSSEAGCGIFLFFWCSDSWCQIGSVECGKRGWIWNRNQIWNTSLLLLQIYKCTHTQTCWLDSGFRHCVIAVYIHLSVAESLLSYLSGLFLWCSCMAWRRSSVYVMDCFSLSWALSDILWSTVGTAKNNFARVSCLWCFLKQASPNKVLKFDA